MLTVFLNEHKRDSRRQVMSHDTYLGRNMQVVYTLFISKITTKRQQKYLKRSHGQTDDTWPTSPCKPSFEFVLSAFVCFCNTTVGVLNDSVIAFVER